MPGPRADTAATGALTRTAGGLAALICLAAGVAFAVAVVATQGVFYPGFVSEAGIAGAPHLLGYQLGVFGVSLGMVLLGVGVRALAAAAAVALAASGVLGAVSGSVACTQRCPLPPFATPTAADLVHGAASVIGVGLCGLAVLLIALGRHHGPVRLLARTTLWPLCPLGALMAVELSFVGRGPLIGIAERTVLVVLLVWMCLTGALIAAGRAEPASAG